jgi:peptide deformylase
MAKVEGEVVEEELDAENEARRRLALAQIRQYPDVALRMPAREVEEFDDYLVQLVERMIDLMREAQGVGLAAPQIGVLQRVFVFAPEDEAPRAIVNPVLKLEGEKVTEDEGCLSMSDVRVPVERSARVVLAG